MLHGIVFFLGLPPLHITLWFCRHLPWVLLLTSSLVNVKAVFGIFPAV